MSQKRRKLSGKQRAFIEAYLGDANFNATQAARLAGYKGNDVTLASVGWENLRKPQIKQRISECFAESAMSADEVLARLAEQARGEHRQYMALDGTLDIERLVEDGKAHLIKAIKPGQYGTLYEFYNAQSALALIGKHHILFVDRQQSLNIDVAALTDEQVERIANGEDPIIVCATPTSSKSGTGEAPQAKRAN